DRYGLQRSGEARQAITGGNDERHTLFGQPICNGKGIVTIQVDIENCDIEAQQFGFRRRVVEAGRDADNLAADLGERIFKQHRHYRLVFYDEHSNPRKISWRYCHTPYSALRLPAPHEDRVAAFFPPISSSWASMVQRTPSRAKVNRTSPARSCARP